MQTKDFNVFCFGIVDRSRHPPPAANCIKRHCLIAKGTLQCVFVE